MCTDALARGMVGNGARRLLPLGPDQQVDGIGDEMASATFDLSARLRDARPAALCGFDRLAVDDPRRPARRATLHSASVTSCYSSAPCSDAEWSDFGPQFLP